MKISGVLTSTPSHNTTTSTVKIYIIFYIYFNFTVHALSFLAFFWMTIVMDL